MQTRSQFPFVFWGTAAVTGFTALQVTFGGAREAEVASSRFATGAATYISPYQLITPATAAVPPVERNETPIREAAPSRPPESTDAVAPRLSPVRRSDLDQVNVTGQGKGLAPKSRPELHGLQIDTRSGAGGLRPVERPELNSLQGDSR